jgi:hypothetical protein
MLRYERTQSETITELPAGKSSTKGCGKHYPNPLEAFVDEDGVEVPLGKILTHSAQYDLIHNEYVFLFPFHKF